MEVDLQPDTDTGDTVLEVETTLSSIVVESGGPGPVQQEESEVSLIDWNISSSFIFFARGKKKLPA